MISLKKFDIPFGHVRFKKHIFRLNIQSLKKEIKISHQNVLLFPLKISICTFHESIRMKYSMVPLDAFGVNKLAFDWLFFMQLINQIVC